MEIAEEKASPCKTSDSIKLHNPFKNYNDMNLSLSSKHSPPNPLFNSSGV
ncbi:uncharacterized protein METZ01_LOCUS331889 [marine metagenome]|uniref:Uncharacterized protein n=1 Tax=marine metagenome TaxID=408172 RepID=A0A382Q258_9ZZZZ